jgi:hypothetical protein
MKITIPRSKRPLKLKSVKISAKKIQSIIEQEVNEALKHFKDEENGGWRLDKSFLTSEIYRNVFGVFVEDEIDQAFINAGLCISYQDGKSYVELKEGYKPIYFNEKTGKIKVVENSGGNNYIFKYRSKNGWFFIGCL